MSSSQWLFGRFRLDLDNACLGHGTLAMQRSQEALALAQELAHPYSLAVAQHWGGPSASPPP